MYWNIKINEKDYGINRLSTFIFPAMQTGSVIELTSNVPELKNMRYPNLQLEIRDCAIKIFRKNIWVYEKNMDHLKNQNFIGKGILNVPLRDLKSGEEIQIIFYTNEKNAFSKLKPVKFIPLSDAFSSYVVQNIFIFVCIAFLFVLGLTGFALSLKFWVYRKKALTLFVLTQLVFWSSIWLFCKHYFIQFFSLDFALNSVIRFFSLEIVLICNSLLYYLCFTHSEKKRKFLKIFIKCMIVVFILLWILHFTNFFHLSRHDPFIYFFTVVIVFFSFINVCYELLKKPLLDSIPAVGFFLLYLLFLFDFICYFVFYLNIGTFAYNRNTWFAVGIVSLSVSIIVDFIFQLAWSAAEDIDNFVVEESRSIDFVTNVLTRESLMSKFSDYEKSKKNFAIVYFEFVNMPEVTTEIGAKTFYKTISFFSGLINHVFGIVGDIGRVSNTSFVVISTVLSEKRLQQLLSTFQNIFNSDNNQQDKNISVLIGSAFSYEISDCNCRSLYVMARERRAVMLFK